MGVSTRSLGDDGTCIPRVVEGVFALEVRGDGCSLLLGRGEEPDEDFV